MREDRATASTLPRDAARVCRSELLAMILFEKFAQHQPLNRQSERYTREGIDLSVSTLADQVGACAAALKPVHALIEAHVLAAGRLHAMTPRRSWPAARPIPVASGPASEMTGRSVEHRRRRHSTMPRATGGRSISERHLKTFGGSLQADAYGGYNPLFKGDRDPGPLTQALCWAHAHRKFFVPADIATNAERGRDAAPISPIAFEEVKRIDALFDIEGEINGISAGTPPAGKPPSCRCV